MKVGQQFESKGHKGKIIEIKKVDEMIVHYVIIDAGSDSFSIEGDPHFQPKKRFLEYYKPIETFKNKIAEKFRI